MNEPWQSFLTDLDAKLAGATELHCLGGFVVAEHYGLIRATGDIDVLEIRGAAAATLIGLSGKNSELHKRYKVYLDYVTVAEVPYEYESRLISVFEEDFNHLQLRAFERHDLVLAKAGSKHRSRSARFRSSRQRTRIGCRRAQGAVQRRDEAIYHQSQARRAYS